MADIGVGNLTPHGGGGGGREGFKLRGKFEVTTMKTSRDNAIHWSAVRLKVVLWSKRMFKGDFFLYHYQENI